MTFSITKLIAVLATAVALLVSCTTMAKAGGGRPGQNDNNTGKGNNPTAILRKQNIARGQKKEQQLQANKNFTITHGGGNLPKEPGNNPDKGNGFTVTQGGGNLPKEPGNNPDKSCDHDCHKHGWYDHCSPRDYCCPKTCVEPMEMVDSYIVLPGDTFDTISMKVFGDSSIAPSIATFNRLPLNFALEPGQTLMLPAVGDSRSL